MWSSRPSRPTSRGSEFAAPVRRGWCRDPARIACLPASTRVRLPSLRPHAPGRGPVRKFASAWSHGIRRPPNDRASLLRRGRRTDRPRRLASRCGDAKPRIPVSDRSRRRHARDHGHSCRNATPLGVGIAVLDGGLVRRRPKSACRDSRCRTAPAPGRPTPYRRGCSSDSLHDPLEALRRRDSAIWCLKAAAPVRPVPAPQPSVFGSVPAPATLHVEAPRRMLRPRRPLRAKPTTPAQTRHAAIAWAIFCRSSPCACPTTGLRLRLSCASSASFDRWSDDGSLGGIARFEVTCGPSSVRILYRIRAV